MSTWERIREARADVTDYVVHLTRFKVERDDGTRDVRDEFRRLKDILKAGYLRPTFAPRLTLQKNRNRMVKGRHKAVCFTAQPLEQIPVTLKFGMAYAGYGIALSKVDLYDYGARPAIYGDEAELSDLGQDLKYRWVRYRPLRPGSGGYPNDFTFEREWRCRMADGDSLPWGHRVKGVPLLLPMDFRRVSCFGAAETRVFKNLPPDFRIIVSFDDEVEDLREYLLSLKSADYRGEYFRIYRLALRKAQIISLEHVKRRLAKDDYRFRRIEDLYTPKERLDVIRIPKKVTA